MSLNRNAKQRRERSQEIKESERTQSAGCKIRTEFM